MEHGALNFVLELGIGLSQFAQQQINREESEYPAPREIKTAVMDELDDDLYYIEENRA